MAMISVVTTICDNCGASETRKHDSHTDDGWRNELPSIYSTSSIMPVSATFLGRAPDYCPDCITAVKDAIAAALETRKQARVAVR